MPNKGNTLAVYVNIIANSKLFYYNTGALLVFSIASGYDDIEFNMQDF